jgi:hemolysin activation/secretion protein
MRLSPYAWAAALMGLLITECACTAHAGETVIPNVSTVQQQMQQGLPHGAQAPLPHLEALGPMDEDSPSGIAFAINRIVIVGHTCLTTDELHALVQEAEGQTLTLAALEQVIARITARYQRQGYPLARAIVPSQTIVDGVVHVHVIEARYDVISLNNRTEVSDALLYSALQPLRTGQVIVQAPLDYALWVLSDIPGVMVNATLKPGGRPGATDLTVTTTPVRARLSGHTVIDNYGNVFVGLTRLTQTLRLINPTRFQAGDALDVSVMSAGSALNYASLAYSTVLANAGTHAGVSYSALHYALGGALAASATQGDAQVTQIWVRRSVVRGDAAHLAIQLQYERAQLSDRVGIDIDKKRHIDKVSASLSGDSHDGRWFGADHRWSLGLTHGLVSDDAGGIPISAVVDLPVSFTKVNGHFSRLQNLSARDSLYAAMNLQWASHNLESSEKMTVGGASTVRAANASALSGDLGVLVNVEFRHMLAPAWLRGNLQLTAFWDYAQVQLNQTALGLDQNRAQIDGMGMGLLWTGERMSIKAQMAKLGRTSAPTLANQVGAVRGWLELSRAYW